MILIDYKDRRPIYEQVVEKMSELMVRGILEQNSQLPSVRSLATELSINPNTIQRAYAELERQGYIYSVKGRGSFVAENHQIREQKKREIFVRLGKLVEEAKGAEITMLQFQEQVIQLYGNNDRKPRVFAAASAAETSAATSGADGLTPAMKEATTALREDKGGETDD